MILIKCNNVNGFCILKVMKLSNEEVIMIYKDKYCKDIVIS